MVDEKVDKINEAKKGVPPDSYHDVPPDNSHQQSLADFLRKSGIDTENLADIHPSILQNYIEAYESKKGDRGWQNIGTNYSGKYNSPYRDGGWNESVPGPIDRNLIDMVLHNLNKGKVQERGNVTGTKDKNNVPPEKLYNGVRIELGNATNFAVVQASVTRNGDPKIRSNFPLVMASTPIHNQHTLKSDAGGGPPGAIHSESKVFMNILKNLKNEGKVKEGGNVRGSNDKNNKKGTLGMR